MFETESRVTTHEQGCRNFEEWWGWSNVFAIVLFVFLVILHPSWFVVFWIESLVFSPWDGCRGGCTTYTSPPKSSSSLLASSHCMQPCKDRDLFIHLSPNKIYTQTPKKKKMHKPTYLLHRRGLCRNDAFSICTSLFLIDRYMSLSLH